MNLEMLKIRLQNREPKPEGDYKLFSILVPIVKVKDELHLLFEIRSEKLKTQPKEICFPGGRIEKDETPMTCAIRETCEELNLTSEQIHILGPLDYLVLPYNFILYPFLGILENVDADNVDFNKDEVGSIFTVPVNFFMTTEPLKHSIDVQTYVDESFPFHMIQNGEEYHWKKGRYPVYFYAYQNHIIWGITARIIKNMVDLLKE